MSRIYLSAAYARRNEIADIAAKLRRMGHTVTSTWHDAPEEPMDATTEQKREWCSRDFWEIDGATILVAFTDGDTRYPGGMRHVEWGYAHAKRCLLYLVAKPDHIGHAVKDTAFDSTATFLEWARHMV